MCGQLIDFQQFSPDFVALKFHSTGLKYGRLNLASILLVQIVYTFTESIMNIKTNLQTFLTTLLLTQLILVRRSSLRFLRDRKITIAMFFPGPLRFNFFPHYIGQEQAKFLPTTGDHFVEISFLRDHIKSLTYSNSLLCQNTTFTANSTLHPLPAGVVGHSGLCINLISACEHVVTV